MLRKLSKIVSNAIADKLAPYYVGCSYGTFKACWSLSAAQAWLPYCGPHAVISSRYEDRVILSRIQTAA